MLLVLELERLIAPRVRHDTANLDALNQTVASREGEGHACRRRLTEGRRRTLVGQIGRSGKHVIYHGSPSAPRVYSNPRFIIITPDLRLLEKPYFLDHSIYPPIKSVSHLSLLSSPRRPASQRIFDLRRDLNGFAEK
jgi:hypothetical protein